jgi:hypothetical protein
MTGALSRFSPFHLEPRLVDVTETRWQQCAHSRRKGASVRTPEKKNHDACSWDLARRVASRNEHTQRAAPPSPPPCRRRRGGGAGGRGMSGGHMRRVVRGSTLRARPGQRRLLSSQNTVGENRSSGEKTTVPASRRAPASPATHRQRLGRCSQLLYVSRAKNGKTPGVFGRAHAREVHGQWPCPTSMLRRSHP